MGIRIMTDPAVRALIAQAEGVVASLVRDAQTLINAIDVADALLRTYTARFEACRRLDGQDGVEALLIELGWQESGSGGA